MHLYLVQHGLAQPKDENPERPLSDRGRTDVGRMASFLARTRPAISRGHPFRQAPRRPNGTNIR